MVYTVKQRHIWALTLILAVLFIRYWYEKASWRPAAVAKSFPSKIKSSLVNFMLQFAQYTAFFSTFGLYFRGKLSWDCRSRLAGRLQTWYLVRRWVTTHSFSYQQSVWMEIQTEQWQTTICWFHCIEKHLTYLRSYRFYFFKYLIVKN